MNNKKNILGFLGSGNIAEAILRSVLKAGTYMSSQIIASDISAERRSVFEKLGASVTESNTEVCDKADLLICALKPQDISTVLKEVYEHCRKEQLFISVAAGVSTESVEYYLEDIPVVRVMPNTPLLVGSGACALSRGTHSDENHVKLVKDILETGGIAVEINENMMDIVTALSGSGPAYFFYIVEAFIRAAGDEGLNRDIAETLLFQTIKGSADMLLETDLSPEKLRRMVTSPGGTTEAAIKYFEKNDLCGTLKEGFQEAVERSKQLRHKDS